MFFMGKSKAGNTLYNGKREKDDIKSSTAKHKMCIRDRMIGVGAVLVYVLVLAFLVFTVIDKTVGLRVSEEEERDGLDVHEHGAPAYANFNLHRDK